MTSSPHHLSEGWRRKLNVPVDASGSNEVSGVNVLCELCCSGETKVSDEHDKERICEFDDVISCTCIGVGVEYVRSSHTWGTEEHSILEGLSMFEVGVPFWLHDVCCCVLSAGCTGYMYVWSVCCWYFLAKKSLRNCFSRLQFRKLL